MVQPPRPNRADVHGTDVEIWYEHGVFADVRTGAPDGIHQILREHGFAIDPDWLGPSCRVLARDDGWADDKACATRATEALTKASFTASLDPILLSRGALAADHDRYQRRRQAATRTSPTAGAATASTPDTTAPAPKLPASSANSRAR